MLLWLLPYVAESVKAQIIKCNSTINHLVSGRSVRRVLNLHRERKIVGENRGEMGISLVTTGRMATLQWVVLIAEVHRLQVRYKQNLYGDYVPVQYCALVVHGQILRRERGKGNNNFPLFS